jgi:hypothetical protein
MNDSQTTNRPEIRQKTVSKPGIIESWSSRGRRGDRLPWSTAARLILLLSFIIWILIAWLIENL